MRTVRNITVCVSPELYRQTKQLAAKYDTTVTGVVAFLLERLPDALKRTAYPVGGIKRRPIRSKLPQIEQSMQVLAAKAVQIARPR
jgi:hypothetical protein